MLIISNIMKEHKENIRRCLAPFILTYLFLDVIAVSGFFFQKLYLNFQSLNLVIYFYYLPKNKIVLSTYSKIVIYHKELTYVNCI